MNANSVSATFVVNGARVLLEFPVKRYDGVEIFERFLRQHGTQREKESLQRRDLEERRLVEEAA